MGTVSRLKEINGRFSYTVRRKQNQYSEFVDRVNAQRFKSMVGASGRNRIRQPKLGLPFSVERPHVAAAHRQLEDELKPAARAAGSHSSFGSRSVFHVVSSSILASEFLIAFTAICGVICAYAVTRSFK